jgi:hypothetical protein
MCAGLSNALAICIGNIYSLNCVLIFVDKHYKDKDRSFNRNERSHQIHHWSALRDDIGPRMSHLSRTAAATCHTPPARSNFRSTRIN